MKALRRSHTCSSSSSSSSKSTPSSSSSKKHHRYSSSSPLSASWVHLRSALFVVASSSPASSSSHRGNLKSPWCRKRRKCALSPQKWKNSFTPDGKLHDGGIKLLKKVRSGGIDPSVRVEVWPFLLGVYALNSSKEERDVVRNRNRKEYEKLRRQSRRFLRQTDESLRVDSNVKRENTEPSSPASEDVVSARESLSSERESDLEFSEIPFSSVLDRTSSSRRITSSSPSVIYDSSDVGSSEDEQFDEDFSPVKNGNVSDVSPKGDLSPTKTNMQSNICRTEDFATWQRIIRVDALRANAEWVAYCPSQAAVSEDRAQRCAEAVCLKDYDHLEPFRVYHAARLVAILEAYAVYDSEIGYCQGMSDLLSPIISVIEQDHMAFWCFVGFMKKARHNFRLDEVGIRRQLDIVAKIIKHRDSRLYRHLEKLQADDCCFVYRMVVVLFRRELNFEQALCLWEVMWADQAALRAGLGKSRWSRIRQRPPPTDDLLLYAIAASVLQRRKQIIEKYHSMDEILRECNNMAGQLDVWKLLDDAHDLVMSLHDKIGTTF
ncbi:rab GTPase-activating protein 22-like isoform X1 [Amaranthus tricolor]|uniref:rab GTPase-activating protein 22-like isoform X1 n=1 Tax=Amaranthus tricolor TaxID=29722 RepID=UPI00258D1CFA|nr:rab GTPase-activating protein 22-like isoform X1 [Amaranthus tricolor]